MSKSIKFIIFCVIIPFLIGFGLGRLVKADLKKQEKQEIKMTLDGYLFKYTDLGLDLNSKTVKLDTTIASNQQTVDNLINEYLLNTHTLYEEIYHYAKDKDLLTKDIKMYTRAYNLLSSIYESQQEAYESMNNILLQASIGSTIFVIESKQSLEMANELTRVTCEDILKIDPENQQVMETLNKLK